MTQPANATSFPHSSPQPCSHNLAASSSSDSSNRSEVPAPLSCSPTANDVRPLNGYARALTLWFSPISVAYSSPYYVHPEGTAMEALQNPFPETTMQRQVVNAAQAERIQLNLSEQFPLNIPLGRVGNHHNTHIHGAHMPSQGQIFDQEEEVEEVASEKWWHSTASGVVGGVFCVYAGQPFDTIKVRLQTQNPANKIYSNPLDCFKKTVSAEGFKSLYKGSSAALASVVLENAVLFTANSHAKNFIRSISNIDSNTDLTLGQEAMAGGMAGFFSSTAITPAEVIKCRMQIQATSSVGPVYKNPADALMQIVKKEGPTGLFKGLSSVWMRDIPFNFVFLGSYEAYCSLAGWQLGKERDELGAGELFFSGGMAGVTGWSVVFPMDAIKSKIQTSTLAKANVVDIVKHTLKTEGIRGFYQGWSAAVMRAFPANAALLLGVELSRKFFEDL